MERKSIFDLLKPQDVLVLVRQDPSGVQITGTARECAALTDFVALIDRHQGKSEHEVRHLMEDARRRWTTHRSYKLSKHKAKSLFDALAPDDVPVLVSWDGSRVKVDASPEDQSVIARVVRIMRGRRL